MSPRLPTRTAKQVIKTLEKNGYILNHVTGSHHAFYNSESNRHVTVPVHSKDIPKGTLHAIIKQSGLRRSDF